MLFSIKNEMDIHFSLHTLSFESSIHNQRIVMGDIVSVKEKSIKMHTKLYSGIKIANERN
ncbi:hypothetical protein AGMMS49940_13910 [Spirochaetia bacterium]|nr:hypothetical protein AGMMS49940_13910 [Spirochaetia bacterium]